MGILDGKGALVTGGSRGIGRAIVTRLAAGATDTELLRSANPGETFEQTITLTSLKRLGRPEDIASAVAMLAGPDAAWITGQNILVDGGILP